MSERRTPTVVVESCFSRRTIVGIPGEHRSEKVDQTSEEWKRRGVRATGLKQLIVAIRLDAISSGTLIAEELRNGVGPGPNVNLCGVRPGFIENFWSNVSSRTEGLVGSIWLLSSLSKIANGSIRRVEGDDKHIFPGDISMHNATPM